MRKQVSSTGPRYIIGDPLRSNGELTIVKNWATFPDVAYDGERRDEAPLYLLTMSNTLSGSGTIRDSFASLTEEQMLELFAAFLDLKQQYDEGRKE